MFYSQRNNYGMKSRSIRIKKILITLIFLIMTTSLFAQSSSGRNNSGSVIRFTAGTMFTTETDASDFEPVPLGDGLLFKLNYSTSSSSGIGFTGGLQVGVIGVFHDAGVYDYTAGTIYDMGETYFTPTSGFSLGGEAGVYYRISDLFGVYAVLNLNIIYATPENVYPDSYSVSMFDGIPSPQFGMVGALVGFDIFVSRNVPVTVELGIIGGSMEFFDDEYVDRIGFTVAVGLGYAFYDNNYYY